MLQRDNAPWGALPGPRLSWRSDGTTESLDYGDVYHSAGAAAAEARHVYLDGNALRERFASDRCRRVGETGFGCGLNFLQTWALWREAAPAGATLYYWAVEAHPLRPEALARSLAGVAAPAPLMQELLRVYPPPVPGIHRLPLDGGRVTLDLVFADVLDGLEELASTGTAAVEAWHLDGFSPARNPRMWQPEVLAAIAACSAQGATCASFTVAGAVRRGLADAGFQLERSPGFGHKRECLRGAFRGPVASPPPAAWDLPDSAAQVPATALVVGAGLAGCAVAASLARRGIEVRVLDSGAIAGAGSGNQQGILFTRLSHRHSTVADFSLAAFLFAGRRYRALFEDGALRPGLDGDLSGCVQLLPREDGGEALRRVLAGAEDLASVVGGDEVRDLIGAPLHGSAALWLPGSGWLNPPAVCRALVHEAGVRCELNCGPLQLAPTASGWCVRGRHGVLASADVAIIATGTTTPSELDLGWLPLRPVRGQTTTLASGGALRALRASLCHEGYLAPARAGRHCIGATFRPGDDGLERRAIDDQHNIEALQRILPREDRPAAIMGARVALRAATPDRLPVVGPAPDRKRFLKEFSALGGNARRDIARPLPALPGLFLSQGHGSRGLSYALLSGELVASIVSGGPLPVPRHINRAVSPARFLVRALARGGVAS